MVNKQLDTPHQPQAGADNNLHKIFIQDVLSPTEDSSKTATPKKEPEKSAMTPAAGPNPLLASGEVFVIPPEITPDSGKQKGEGQADKKGDGQTDKSGKGDGKKTPYRSPFGSVQDTVSYLDLDHSFKPKTKPDASKLDPLNPIVGPQLPKPEVKKAEVLPLPRIEVPKPDAKKDVPVPPAKQGETPKPDAKKDAPVPAKPGETPKPDAKKDVPVPPAKPDETPKPDAKKDAPVPAKPGETPKPDAKKDVPVPPAKPDEVPKPDAKKDAPVPPAKPGETPPQDPKKEIAPPPKPGEAPKEDDPNKREVLPPPRPAEKEEMGPPAPEKVDEKSKGAEKEAAPKPRPVPVDTPDGKGQWSVTEAGDWQLKDQFGKVTKEHPDFPGRKVTDVSKQDDGSVKITLDNGKILRERPDGGKIHYPNEAAFKKNQPNEIAGRFQDIEWDGDKMKSYFDVAQKKQFHQVDTNKWVEDPKAAKAMEAAEKAAESQTPNPTFNESNIMDAIKLAKEKNQPLVSMLTADGKLSEEQQAAMKNNPTNAVFVVINRANMNSMMSRGMDPTAFGALRDLGGGQGDLNKIQTGFVGKFDAKDFGATFKPTKSGTIQEVMATIKPPVPPKRQVELDGATGTLKQTYLEGPAKGTREEVRSNGIRETYNTDGSMKVEVPTYKGGKYVFTFKDQFTKEKQSLQNPDEFKVVSKTGSETVWKKGDKEYTSGSQKWKADIALDKDGTYSYTEKDSGEKRSQTVTGRIEETNPKEKSTLIKDKDQILKAKVGDQELQVDYGEDGKPSEYRHVNENRKLTKNSDGSWADAPIDSNKPYTKPSDFEKDVYSHKDLDPIQKMRLIENTKKFDAMTKFSDAEKKEVYKQADRLLKGRSDSAMPSNEKAALADQLFWHIANDTRNEQGYNNTCNVTVLRGLLFKDQPSVVAKLAADVANDGQFVTKDGSTIRPPMDSVRAREGSPEATFPPKGGRTGLSKLWDVSACNAVFQRDTKDPFGQAVAKGFLRYEEVPPEGRSDTGARIVRKNTDGSEYVLYLNKSSGGASPYDSPRMYPSRIADAWEQMTGQKLEGRFLIHNNRGVDDSTIFNRVVGSKINSEKELETALMKDDTAKIIGGNTGLLSQRYKQQLAVNEGKDPNTVTRAGGGEHVWLVTGYDAKTKTVTLDNSWDPGYDMPSKADAAKAGRDMKKLVTVSLKDLYDTMQASSPGEGGTILWYTRPKK